MSADLFDNDAEGSIGATAWPALPLPGVEPTSRHNRRECVLLPQLLRRALQPAATPWGAHWLTCHLEGVSMPIASQGTVGGRDAPGCTEGCLADTKDDNSFKVDIEGRTRVPAGPVVATALATMPVVPTEAGA